jgi:hypothetical protein
MRLNLNTELTMKPGTYSTLVEEWLRGLVTVTAAKAVVAVVAKATIIRTR